MQAPSQNDLHAYASTHPLRPISLKPFGDFPIGNFRLLVYFEDTDAIGITYHGSYIHFLDRARYTYWKEHIHLIVKGLPREKWQEAASKVMPNIYSINVVYYKSTRLDDPLLVQTLYVPISDFRSLWDQRIINETTQEVVLAAHVEVVYVNNQGKLIPLPTKEYILNYKEYS